MKADVIFKSNAVYDGMREYPFAGFVAVKGNRIVGVGETSLAESYTDATSRILECGNRLIMPGFHDSHTHLVLAGMYKASVNLGTARSEEETVAQLLAFDRQNPTTGWLYGFNWYHVFWNDKVLPTKRTLDQAFPDRPVFLLNAEAHGAWVNSRALELAGIDRETKDPFGGSFERFSDGEPTGFLYEGAIADVARRALALDPEYEKTCLRHFMQTAAPLGITSVVDVQPYFGINLGNLDVYREMEAKGELSVRIHAASDLFGDLDQAAAERDRCIGGQVRANLLKQFVDGVFTTHTALMLEDYSDAPGNRGIQLCELERIEEAVMEAHRRGLSVKIHAIGDRAIRFTLDCYEKAIVTYGRNRARHAVEHVELATEADIGRFGELGIVPSVQPEHVGLFPTWAGEEYRTVVGGERASQTWRFRSLLQSAGMLAIGSDCPVVDNNPFAELYRGLTRVHDDGLPEGGWNPSEKLTLGELLRGYTYGSAYGVGREHELGTLQTGMLADVIVLDRNLFAEAPESIRNAKVDYTMADGRIVFERSENR